MNHTQFAKAPASEPRPTPKPLTAEEIYQKESRKMLKSMVDVLAVDLAWSMVGLK